ncbi:MAG: O-antigen ligase family protein [Acidimicrobiia bacterium]|nr:O-antigen ligase family protein [Acidimicrobiia bacterium]NNF70108.1 O-antigen ligase family protein [Acidimicrobiia bacterium]NNK91805.1 O-antigen ligase family protein [Acidimicrobiia bacterium]
MTDRSGPFPLLLRGALVVLIVMLPIEVGVILDEAPGVATGYGRLAVFHPFDLALMVVAVLGFPYLIGRRLGWGTGTMLVLLVGAMVGLVFNATPRGWMQVARLAALTVTAGYISQLSDRERTRLVVAPLMVTVGLQSLIGVAQVLNDGPIGLGTFGERELRYFYGFGDVVAAQGTTIHGYVLAGFAMVATLVGMTRAVRRGASPWWLVGIAVCAIPIGLTYSRMALIGMILVMGALGWGVARDRARYLVPTVVVIVAITVPALFALDGWTQRELSDERQGLDRLSTGRITLMREAATMIGDHPIVGVGPGNYVTTIEADFDVEVPKQVHSVPLLVAAEDGVVWGLASLVMLAAVGLAALRSGPVATALFLGFVPFWILDKFPYTHPNGLVLTAIWLAMLESLDRDDPAQEPSAQVTAASA